MTDEWSRAPGTLKVPRYDVRVWDATHLCTDVIARCRKCGHRGVVGLESLRDHWPPAARMEDLEWTARCLACREKGAARFEYRWKCDLTPGHYDLLYGRFAAHPDPDRWGDPSRLRGGAAPAQGAQDGADDRQRFLAGGHGLVARPGGDLDSEHGQGDRPHDGQRAQERGQAVE